MRQVLVGSAVALALVAFPVTSTVASASQVAAAPRVHTVTVGSNPTDVVLSQRQSRAYVLNDGSVSVLSLKTRRQLAEPGTGFHDQTAIGLVRKGRAAYIGTFDLNVLKVLNTSTLKVTRTVRVGPGATAIVAAGTGAGQFAYVTQLASGGSSGHVVVVRTSNARVVKKIKLGAGAQSAAATRSGHSVWVAAPSPDGSGSSAPVCRRWFAGSP